MSKFQNYLNYIADPRARRSLRSIFSHFLNDDTSMTFKDIVFGSGTTIISMAGTFTTGLSISGAGATPISITGAFTTGISIAADGTTGITITSAFSGVTGLSIAGTASGDGILISGACADAIHISGSNTASALHISGDQVIGILFDVDAAATDGFKILVDDGITLTTGINIDRSGTTGVCTTAISIDTDGTTGIEIAAGFTGVTAISLAGTGSSAGINISGNHTTAITIAAQTTAGVAITGATATGISITGACSTAALQMGVSGTPAGDFIWYGTTALYKVLFDANGDTNGAVYIGADTKGLMFNLYGDITGCGVFWDPSGDTNGALSIGATGGSKGVDVTMFGATSGCYMKWDQSADSLEVVKTSAIATATNLYSVNIGQTLTGASAVNTAEVLRSILTSNVQVGNWANAILGKVDFSSAGFVTGLAGVVCAELDMPAATIANGSYCCFEAELNAPTGALGWGTTVPVAFLTGNAWGTGVAEFRDDGYIFNFTGVGSATGGKIFDTCTAAAASHALRILIDGTPYYIMLNSNVDA